MCIRDRKYIIRYGSRTVVDRHIKAVYEIDKFLFREAPEEVAVSLQASLPIRTGLEFLYPDKCSRIISVSCLSPRMPYII